MRDREERRKSFQGRGWMGSFNLQVCDCFHFSSNTLKVFIVSGDTETLDRARQMDRAERRTRELCVRVCVCVCVFVCVRARVCVCPCLD